MNILIVDDDKNTLVMLKLRLSGEGRRVEAFAEWREALELLKKEPFDWLIVDGQMEPVGGFEAAEQAKALCPGLRIVMISGAYSSEDIRGRPISRLFQKPVDTDEMLAYMGAGGGRA